jgi:hypothetical protein
MQWRCSDANGRNALVGQFLERQSDVDGEPLLRTRIELVGTFWPRLGSGLGHGLIPDFSVVLHQVLLRHKQVELLLRELEAWLIRPSALSVELGRASNNDQSLTLSLGVSDKFISKADRPACVIEYSSGAFSVGEWGFVVDQTCIQQLVDELSAAMLQLGRS